jgi:hypothetical protein
MDAEDALYGLPLEEFVPQRDALAKRLRNDGDREGAARVKALRKPTVAAWAVNQVVRTQGAALRELDAAGLALREAQAELLSGKGSGADLRAAGERERAAVAELVKAARGLLTHSGGSLSESVMRDVGETLHAATFDDDTRAAVLAGRLDRERTAVGLGGELGVMAAAASAPAAGSRARRAKVEESPAQARRERDRAAAARKEEIRATGAAAKEAVGAARRAEKDHARAEARLEAAEEGLTAAMQAREDARTAERAARRARDQAVREAERRLAALEALEGRE